MPLSDENVTQRVVLLLVAIGLCGILKRGDYLAQVP
jgi:hypothetical protein